jgi:hypothetical protein
MTKKKEWEKGLDYKIDNELREIRKTMKKLEKNPDPIISKLLHFQTGKLTDELIVRKTSKHLNDQNYAFEVDEDGDFVFEFTGGGKLDEKGVHGYV